MNSLLQKIISDIYTLTLENLLFLMAFKTTFRQRSWSTWSTADAPLALARWSLSFPGSPSGSILHAMEKRGKRSQQRGGESGPRGAARAVGARTPDIPLPRRAGDKVPPSLQQQQCAQTRLAPAAPHLQSTTAHARTHTHTHTHTQSDPRRARQTAGRLGRRLAEPR